MTEKTLDLDTMLELGLLTKETEKLYEQEPKFRAGPETRKAKAPKTLPKSKPKMPTKLPKPKPKSKSSGVTFDTSGTTSGKTIERMNNGGAVMSGRGGKFKGIF